MKAVAPEKASPGPMSRPQKISQRVCIVRPGGRAEVGAHGAVLQIGAAQAFGDGAHPSTRLAIRLLDGLLDEAYGAVCASDGWVLDLGCGTGILALSVAALSGFKVLGLDISQAAVLEAERNRRLNRARGLKVHLVLGDQRCCKGPFFVVLANLVPAAHVQLAESLWGLVAPGGWMILSGFKENQKGLIGGPYLGRGALASAMLSEAGWGGLLLHRPPNGRKCGRNGGTAKRRRLTRRGSSLY